MIGIFCRECDQPVTESVPKYTITGAGSIPRMTNMPCGHDTGLRFVMSEHIDGEVVTAAIGA